MYAVFLAVIFVFPEAHFNIIHCPFSVGEGLLEGRNDERSLVDNLSKIQQTFFYYAFRLGKDL